MKEVLIEVDNVSKVYKLYEKPIDRLKESLNLSKKKYHKEFYALKNISFQICKGETVGIIGTNGSGKSTLLKIITGVLSPTSGKAGVNGKISALLELGAGFNMEYTGVENIYLNGTMFGYSKKEIDEKLNSIIEFADIGDFVYQPVKTYSSGMFARLAFSVAINVEPNILIVDEALSVGDMAFQEKSITKMKELRDKGTTILFVTHSLPTVRNFCERAIWINKGVIVKDGIADILCDEYDDFMKKKELKDNDLKQIDLAQSSKKTIFIKEVFMNKRDYYMNEDMEITIAVEFNKKIINYCIGIIIFNSKGEIVTLFNTVREDIYFKDTIREVTLKIPKNDFVKDKYYVSVSVCDELVMFAYDKIDYVCQFNVISLKNKAGIPITEGMFRAKHEWSFKD